MLWKEKFQKRFYNFFFIFLFIVVALIYIDLFFYFLVDFDAIFQSIRKHDLLNRLNANVLSIREIVIVEIRDVVFQSICFVNLDVVVKSIRKFELHHLIIIFHFFRWKQYYFTLKKIDKTNHRIKTNWSYFESLKTTSSSLFLNRNFITILRIFAIFTFFRFRNTHTTQHNLIDAFSFFFNNFLFLFDDYFTIIASWSSMKKNNVK